MDEKNITEIDEMLSARVPADLKKSFWNTVPAGSKNQHIMTAAVRLWISLPEELRKKLIDAESNPSAEEKGDSFVEAVRQIAQEEFAKLYKKSKGKKADQRV